jgi:hypothetical protein
MTQHAFYQNPRPLDAVRDATTKVRAITDLGFARRANNVPINLVEFSAAARCYPIGFIGPHAQPAAMVGLREDNLFLNEEGHWKAGAYVPGFVRRYPFIFADTDMKTTLQLCIDDTPQTLSDTDGRPLFENGQPSDLTNQALEFCRQFHAGAQATNAFVAAIKDAGLLIDRMVEIRLADGSTFTLSGFQSIDPDRLRKLPADTLARWNEADWLAPIFLHLQSMTNWNDLMALTPGNGATP